MLQSVYPIRHAVMALMCAIFFGSASTSYAKSHHDVRPPIMRFDRFLTEDSRYGDLHKNVGAIRVIVQDAQGYMWFAGESGLVRFDAYEFKSFHVGSDHPNTICATDIRDMVVDHTGTLWVGSSIGLCRWHPQLEVFSIVPIHTTQDKLTNFINGRATSNKLMTNYVEGLDVGKNNELYIASPLGFSIYAPGRDTFTHYAPDPQQDIHLQSQSISEIVVDRERGIWLGTYESGLYYYDPHTNAYRHWQHISGDKTSLLSNYIETIEQDHHGNIWVISANEGISRLNADGHTFTHYISEYNIDDGRDFDTRDLFVDSQDRLWAALDHGGLALYLPQTDSFYAYTHQVNDNSSLSSNQVRYIYEDQQGNLWIGNFPNGINLYNKSVSVFQTIKHDPLNKNSLSHDGILTIFEDSDKNLWIGTENGLNLYDRTTGKAKHYQHDSNNPFSLRFNAIVGLTEDLQGNLWVSSWSGGLHRFDKYQEKFYNYYPNSSDPGSFSSPYSWNTYMDSQGTLWVGTSRNGGLNRYVPETDSFIRLAHSPNNPNTLSSDRVNDVIEDHSGVFWIATMRGLDILDRQTQKVTRIDIGNKGLTRLPIRTLFEDSQHNIWIGTDGRGIGLINPQRNTIQNFDIEHGLPTSTVYSIIEDDSGEIWFGTTNGISKFNKVRQSFTNYYKSDGIAGNNHNREAVFKDDKGYLYFGSTNGITVFHPNQLQTPIEPSNIVLTELKVLNKTIYPADNSGILSKAIGFTDTLSLNHDDNAFTINFSLLSYRSSFRNKYAYMLEGFDNNWIDVGRQRTAIYTNIDPGHYVFKVKAFNNEGIASNNTAEIAVNIKPAPWTTSWAYIVYVLAFLSLIFWIIHYQLKKIALAKEKALNKELRQLDQIKDRFLSSTSHELRTPISGVIGIAELMLNQKQYSKKDIDRNLQLIACCGRRLSHLINDILDYSKMAANRLQIKPTAVDVHSVIEHVFSLTQSLAEPKHIKLVSAVPASTYVVLADENRLQQILINLVGNAIKYSQSGEIIITALANGEWLEISVTDRGIGIAEDQQSRVFESFHQIERGDQRFSSGTGLGLSITKDLVELHGGKIWLCSKPGEGSCFTFTMPLTAAGVHPISDNRPMELINENYYIDEISTEGEQGEFIMVVDDHQINRIVVRDILQEEGYSIIGCDSGAAAIQQLAQHPRMFALILMDVSMPLMSGFEACSIIRQSHSKTQLPIVFFSVDKSEEDEAQSLNIGGNGFVQKTLNRVTLLHVVQQYLGNRKPKVNPELVNCTT